MNFPYNEETDLLEMEDYIRLKQETYNYVVNDKTANTKSIQEIELPAKEKEIFTITASYPYDKEFCEAYEKDPNREIYIIDNKKLPDIAVQLKKFEIKNYLLDKLIELEIIKPPEVPKVEQMSSTK